MGKEKKDLDEKFVVVVTLNSVKFYRTIGQTLLGEKYVTQKEEYQKNNPKPAHSGLVWVLQKETGGGHHASSL
jgi:hypothetical protein